MIDIEKLRDGFKELATSLNSSNEMPDYFYCAFLLGFLNSAESSSDPDFEHTLDVDFNRDITQIFLEYFPDFQERYRRGITSKRISF